MNSREKFLAQLKEKKDAQKAEESAALAQATAEKEAEERESAERLASKLALIEKSNKPTKAKAKKTKAQTASKKKGRPKKT
tara:strand:- start:8290 stop:8532 length:243 start_codon:yes stop_codon:yes gene_type:complete